MAREGVRSSLLASDSPRRDELQTLAFSADRGVRSGNGPVRSVVTAPVVVGDVATRVEHDGFAILCQALGAPEIASLLTALEEVRERVTRTSRGGARALFERVPEIRTLALSGFVRGAAGAALGPDCFPVRALLLDKTPAANWKVAWHQDLTIAVQARRDVEGYVLWSVKAGVPHAQPPIPILQRMVAVRVHLDACGPDNGPLRVLPGSHRAGRISTAEIEVWRQRTAEVTCIVPRGGLLLMRPLLLHASSPAKSPAHRRVIHIEYAATELSSGLEWYEAWGRLGAKHARGLS
jgi:hypothetical protein